MFHSWQRSASPLPPFFPPPSPASTSILFPLQLPSPLPPPLLLLLPTTSAAIAAPTSLSCAWLRYKRGSLGSGFHCSVEKGRAAVSVRCAEGWCTRRNAFTRCVDLFVSSVWVIALGVVHAVCPVQFVSVVHRGHQTAVIHVRCA